MRKIRQLGEEDFDSGDRTPAGWTLICFRAAWCSSCHRIEPILRELKKRFAGRLRVCEVDVEKKPEARARFGLRGIPTVILFRDGKPVARLVGSQPRAAFEKILSRLPRARRRR